MLLFGNSLSSLLSVVSARLSCFCCVATLSAGVFKLLFLLFVLVVIDSVALTLAHCINEKFPIKFF